MAKTIMIQGTMSNAGKSLLAAGLCRVLRQDGYRVAPFKSQNMALNSFITKDGGEMGRAQVVQAEAAGIEPDVRMNPILLKPTTDVGSQVIVNGRVQGNMPAMEYYRRKRDFIPAVMEAYESLAREYDIIVIEGAGSPAEINLQENDIVNMGLARMVDAPVLLVGDIDRGGVFAQLYGTVALQSEEDRRRIKGVVVNKFRGDRAILEPGLKTLEELCGVPVAGVVPYLHVDIDDEDSLSERFGRDKEPRLIDIAVIRLPRISNFTDFSPFERYECLAPLCGAGAGPARAGYDRDSRYEEYDRRPPMAPPERAGGVDPKGCERRHAGFRRLRRLSDAGAAHFRPRTGRGRGRDGNRRNGPSAARNSISGRKGADADKRRLLRRRGTAL